ncbi:LysM peptidoglycan-binding domain-containing protein [Macrococcoides caseolyticum]|uniref:LysM peptidoglycan-binding domain-containing protein n=1 Tax=Macrococcoides caseolyticum TaxID=69966 RepID=UPI001F331933|nr:LysM peptidoglycan-binding domain-containing protein [Macrococcus caseolyticus]MCE4957606.1 LysM peptidoglycan-binding domain-containing protein [Macrococcus caseolyticus]
MKKLAAITTIAILATGISTQANAKEHTVKQGESLWVIADKYDTTIEKIKKINHLESNLIVPDQKLQVLVNGKYEVQAGDTLSKIARQFDVKVSELKKWNHIKSSKALKPGQLLVVEHKNDKKIVKAPVQQVKTTQTVQQAPAQQAQATQTVQQAPAQQAQAAQAVQQAPVQQTQAQVGNSSVDAHLRMIMQRESGGNPRAVNPAGYYGLFQFSPQTWAAVGGTGNPAQASEAEQWKRARILYTQHGAGHWSTAY